MTYMLWRKDGEQFFDENGNPLNAGYIEYKLTATETDLSIFADPLGVTPLANPVVLDAAGKLNAPLYVGETAFKERGKKSGGTVVFENDGYLGSAPAVVTQEYAKANQVVSPVSASRTITSADYGGVLVCDPTGGDITLTLPPASGVTNGRGFKVVHVGASGKVILQRSTTDLVGGQKAVSLHSYGDAIEAVVDTTAWRLTAVSEGAPYLKRSVMLPVVSRVTAIAPVSPAQGDRYLLPAVGSGQWQDFPINSIAEYAGTTWTAYTPTDGWYADVLDENLLCRFDGTTWVPWTNVGAPALTYAPVAVFQDSSVSGTAAQTPAIGWNTSRLNTQVTLPNPIIGAALASNVMTMPTGKYAVSAWRSVRATATTGSRARLISVTDANKIYYSSNNGVGSGLHFVELTLFADVEVTAATEDFRLEFYSTDTVAAGQTASIASINEIYAHVRWQSLAAAQGPIGVTGPQGAIGATGATGATGPNTGFDFAFNTGTTDADPGSGNLRFNNASIASATFMYVSKTNRVGVSLATRLLEFGGSTTTGNKGLLMIQATADATKYVTALVSGACVDGGTYVKVPVSTLTSAGTIANTAVLAMSFLRTGDAGAITDTAFLPHTHTGTSAIPVFVRAKFSKENTSVSDFGGDPTGAASSVTAFTNALAALSAAGGGRLLVPPGIWLLNSSITVPTKILIEGVGPASVLRRSTDVAGAILLASASDIRIQDMTLEYTAGTVATVNHAVSTYPGAAVNITDIHLANLFVKGNATVGFYEGLNLYNASRSSVKNCTICGIRNRAIALDAEVTTEQVHISGNTLIGYKFGTTTRYTDYGVNMNLFGTGVGKVVNVNANIIVGMVSRGISCGDNFESVDIDQNTIRDIPAVGAPGIYVANGNGAARAPKGVNVTNNNITDCYYGVYTDNGGTAGNLSPANVLIMGNVIRICNMGLLLREPVDHEVIANLIYDASAFAIYTIKLAGSGAASDRCSFIGNRGRGTGAGTGFYGVDYTLASGVDVEYRNNKFTNFAVNENLGDGMVGRTMTGWTAATNTKSRATFDTTTVTTAQLAQRVASLIDDLIVHKIIG